MSPFDGVRPPKGDDPMPGPSLFLRFGLAAVLALAGSCHYGVADIASVPDYPTYAKDVRPLLYDHCLLCHGSSPIRGAPSYFRLDVYDDTDDVFGAKTMAFTVLSSVKNVRMPPAAKDGDGIGPNGLALLERWIDQGTPP